MIYLLHDDEYYDDDECIGYRIFRLQNTKKKYFMQFKAINYLTVSNYMFIYNHELS